MHYYYYYYNFFLFFLDWWHRQIQHLYKWPDHLTFGRPFPWCGTHRGECYKWWWQRLRGLRRVLPRQEAAYLSGVLQRLQETLQAWASLLWKGEFVSQPALRPHPALRPLARPGKQDWPRPGMIQLAHPWPAQVPLSQPGCPLASPGPALLILTRARGGPVLAWFVCVGMVHSWQQVGPRLVAGCLFVCLFHFH